MTGTGGILLDKCHLLGIDFLVGRKWAVSSYWGMPSLRDGELKKISLHGRVFLPFVVYPL